MNNEKFTQGEWKVCYFRKTPFGLEHYLVHEPNYGEVAVVNFHGESGGETEKANAALIAAAPDMFECICDALTDLEMPDGMRNHFEAVLKKARGEQ